MKTIDPASDIAIARRATLRPIEEIAGMLAIPPEALFRYGPFKGKIALDFADSGLDPAPQIPSCRTWSGIHDFSGQDHDLWIVGRGRKSWMPDQVRHDVKPPGHQEQKFFAELFFKKATAFFRSSKSRGWRTKSAMTSCGV